MFRERTNNSQICLRKIAGLICLICGIIVIFTKLIYFICTDDMIPYEGRGKFLVGTGASLLGLTSFDNILNRKEPRSPSSSQDKLTL